MNFSQTDQIQELTNKVSNLTAHNKDLEAMVKELRNQLSNPKKGLSDLSISQISHSSKFTDRIYLPEDSKADNRFNDVLESYSELQEESSIVVDFKEQLKEKDREIEK